MGKLHEPALEGSHLGFDLTTKPNQQVLYPLLAQRVRFYKRCFREKCYMCSQLLYFGYFTLKVVVLL